MNHVWLRQNDLLYRLNYRKVNSHMIRVQMSDDSVDQESTEKLAERLETLLNVSVPSMISALEMAREWITEAKAQGCNLPCANTMAGIRDALKDIPEV